MEVVQLNNDEMNDFLPHLVTFGLELPLNHMKMHKINVKIHNTIPIPTINLNTECIWTPEVMCTHCQHILERWPRPQEQ